MGAGISMFAYHEKDCSEVYRRNPGKLASYDWGVGFARDAGEAKHFTASVHSNNPCR